MGEREVAGGQEKNADACVVVCAAEPGDSARGDDNGGAVVSGLVATSEDVGGGASSGCTRARAQALARMPKAAAAMAARAVGADLEGASRRGGCTCCGAVGGRSTGCGSAHVCLSGKATCIARTGGRPQLGLAFPVRAAEATWSPKIWSVRLRKMPRAELAGVLGRASANAAAARTYADAWRVIGDLVKATTSPVGRRGERVVTDESKVRAAHLRVLAGRAGAASALLLAGPGLPEAEAEGKVLEDVECGGIASDERDVRLKRVMEGGPKDDDPLPPPVPGLGDRMSKVKMDCNAAAGPSGLYPSVLLAWRAEAPEVVGAFLARLAADPPTWMACAKVIPVPKQGLEGVRPISVTEAPARLVEAALMSQRSMQGLRHGCAMRPNGAIGIAAALEAAVARGDVCVEVDVRGAFNSFAHDEFKSAIERIGVSANDADCLMRLFARRLGVTRGGRVVVPPAQTGGAQGSAAVPFGYQAMVDGWCSLAADVAAVLISYQDNVYCIAKTVDAANGALTRLAAAAGEKTKWKAVMASHEGISMAGMTFEVGDLPMLNLNGQAALRRVDRAVKLCNVVQKLPAQTQSVMLRLSAANVLAYDSKFGQRRAADELDVRVATQTANIAGVPVEAARLPVRLAGMGCVPHSVRFEEKLIEVGCRLATTAGVLGECARRDGPAGAGRFWDAFGVALRSAGGAWRDGVICGLPEDLTSLSQASMDALVGQAAVTRNRVPHIMMPSCMARALTGPGLLPALSNAEAAAAARLLTASSRCVTCDSASCGGACICRLCGKASGAWHHWRCAKTPGDRGGPHHAVVRAICAFINETSGVGARADPHGETRIVPDIAVTGWPSVSVIEVKVTAEGSDGGDFVVHAAKLRTAALAKYVAHGFDKERVAVAVFDAAGRCDNATHWLLRKLNALRAARGTWDGREGLDVRAHVGQALAKGEVDLRRRYRGAAFFSGAVGAALGAAEVVLRSSDQMDAPRHQAVASNFVRSPDQVAAPARSVAAGACT